MNTILYVLAVTKINHKELLNQFKAIEKMPDSDKNIVKTLIDAFITKRKVQQLASQYKTPARMHQGYVYLALKDCNGFLNLLYK